MVRVRFCVLGVFLALSETIDADVNICVLSVNDFSVAGDVLVTKVTVDFVRRIVDVL